MDDSHASPFRHFHLSRALGKVTRPLFRKQGFFQDKLLTDWHLIAGERIAAYSTPKRISSYSHNGQHESVLHLDVHHSGIAAEIPYIQSLILERIATYFGYRAITAIRIYHRPLSLKLPENLPSPVVLSDMAREKLSAQVAEIENAELAASLERLGRQVFQRTQTPDDAKKD